MPRLRAMRCIIGPRRFAEVLCALAALATLASPAHAAEPVALVADDVRYDADAGTVTAEGNVEVYYGERTLSADRIVYDSRSGRISASGGLTLRDDTGSTVFADAAEIDADLRNGIVEGAKALISDGAGRLSAVEAQRIDGRYNALAKAVYSPCEVCLASPTPLWSIRAERIVHDEQERVIHYEDAVFEFLGVPIGYLPYFSHAEPGVQRRSGFLAPSFDLDSVFGLGVKTPYFFAIDPTRDLTVTPFITSNDGQILEGEYRQRFDNGGFRLSGSVGYVDTGGRDSRDIQGHVFGDGAFSVASLGLGTESVADFEIARTSDDGYLQRFNFSNDDRLVSRLFVESYGARDFFSVQSVFFQSTRANEPTDGIPMALPDFSLRQVVDAPAGLGEIGFETSGVFLTRPDGRDVARLSLGSDWERRLIFDNGFAVRGFAAARADFFRTTNDPTFDNNVVSRFAPFVGVDVAYPVIAQYGATSHILEPKVQFIAAPDPSQENDIPNEDSLDVEFDETNIFDTSRFSGFDRIEGGSRMNVGLSYSRISDDPFSVDASAGRVFRFTNDTDFTVGTGLSDKASDYVAGWAVGYSPWIRLSNRVRLTDGFAFKRNEIGARLAYGPARLNGTFVFLDQSATAGAFEDQSELALAGEIDVTPNWTLGAFARRDLESDTFVRSGASIAFHNDCAAIEFSVGRDTTNVDGAPSSTTIGLRLRLFGGNDGAAGPPAVCAPTTRRPSGRTVD